MTVADEVAHIVTLDEGGYEICFNCSVSENSSLSSRGFLDSCNTLNDWRAMDSGVRMVVYRTIGHNYRRYTKALGPWGTGIAPIGLVERF